MKIAVIGAGRWGKNLIRTFNELGVLGAIVEKAPTDTIKKDYPNTPFFTDINDISAEEYQAVAIATPVSTHYQTAKVALKKGFDVFVEKPVTLSVSEAEELQVLSQKQSRILMVGHMLLYQPAIRWIANFLTEGALGKLHSLHQERLNLGKARSVENVLWSLGVHDVAVLVNLVGTAPTRIQISGHRVLQSNIEDDAYFHLEFPHGVEAHLHCSWLWPEKRRRLTVIGEKGMLVYDELKQTVTLHRKQIDHELNNKDEGTEVVFHQTEAPLGLELKHFLCRLKDRQPPLSDGQNGVEVVRVLEQATQQLEQV